MPYHRLNPIECDSRYCYVDGNFVCDTSLMRGGPVLRELEQEGIEYLEYELDEEQGGLEVGDYFTNIAGHLPLSRACAEAIVRTWQVGPHELVPARVRNEKGRIHVSDIVVLNPLIAIDCLDWDASETDGDETYPMIQIFGAWSLKAARIPPALDLLRVKGLPGYVFSQRLVDFIRDRGFTNFAFDEARLS